MIAPQHDPSHLERHDEHTNGATIVTWRAVCPCGRPGTWRFLRDDAARDLKGYRADNQRLGRCH